MSRIRETPVSNCEKKFLRNALAEYTRLDGRAFEEFREISLEFGKDWGCCYVSLGETRVLAQISCEIQEPKSQRPSEGILNINLELNPIAAPNFEAGRQSDLAVQLNRILEKCIKDSKAIDLESLCIKAEEKVWTIRADLNIINHEGNILDCASIALLASLAHFKRPDVTCDGEEFIIHDYAKRDPIPLIIRHHPICVTSAIFGDGDQIIGDPNFLEEEIADAHLTIGINSFREICALHLGGKAQVSHDIILRVTSRAAQHALNVVEMIKESVKKDLENRTKQYEINLHGGSECETPNLEALLNTWALNENKTKNKRWKKTAEIKAATNQSETVENHVNTDDRKDDVVMIPVKTEMIDISDSDEN